MQVRLDMHLYLAGCSMRILGRRKRELGRGPPIVVCLAQLKANPEGEMEATRVQRSGESKKKY